MNIAITGGSGFIGELLAEKHLESGDQVRILTRHAPTKLGNSQYFFGDLTDPKVDLSEFVENVDILYHCAGELSNKSLMQSLHVDGTKALVSAARNKVGLWVQLSSIGAYGSCRSGVVTEKYKEKPRGIYETTKTESDSIVQNSDIPFVIVRPSNVFGVSMKNMSLFQLIRVIQMGHFVYLNNHHALVNYVHVGDVVNALFCCGIRNNSTNKIYIVSQSIEVEKMVKVFCRALEVSHNFRNFPESAVRGITRLLERFPGIPLTTSRIDALTSYCKYDSSKIKKELKFEFSSSLEEYLKLMVNIK